MLRGGSFSVSLLRRALNGPPEGDGKIRLAQTSSPGKTGEGFDHEPVVSQVEGVDNY